jgi:tetratricopeptide (TPR) repeat protein
MISLFIKTLFLFLILISHFLFSKKAHGLVKDPLYDDLEGVALIRALLKDGKLELAKEEIQLLESKDVVQYRLLIGQWFFQKGEWKESLKNLSLIQDRTLQPEAQLWMARNYFQMKNFEKCIQNYQHLVGVAFATENDFVSKSHCELKQKKYQEAWKTLWKARENYKSFSVEREFIALQVEMGLVHEALEHSLRWLTAQDNIAVHYLNLAEIFQAKSHRKQAQTVLELGRVRHPLNLDLNLALSQLYFQEGLLLAAEEGFSRAALTDGKYYYHSAELNRQAGHFERSLYFNSLVVEEKERLKQKIATYVDANKYSLIASLDSVIQRSELQKDDEIRYALAYSLVRIGAIEKPLQYLSQITKPELIEKSTVLRQALIDCQAKKEICRL